MRATRLLDRPIITPDLDPSIGSNIQGPSIIRVPDWAGNALARYYLYFADHKGRFIRLAYADEVTGPWRIHRPGALRLEDSHFLTRPPELDREEERQLLARYARRGVRLPHDPLQEATTPHIASPEVIVDYERRVIRMYFHGLEAAASQATRVGESADGLHFVVSQPLVAPSYLRIFSWAGHTYALAMPGQLHRATGGGVSRFEPGPRLFNPNMRHNAPLVRDGVLHVFWTQVGDAPERILLSTIDLAGDWRSWRESEPVEILRPERAWEGAAAPVQPSLRSTAYGTVNQLRDPAILEDEGRTFLLYAVAGESGIALAELRFG